MTPTEKQKLVTEILSLAEDLFRKLLPTVPKDLLILDITMPQFKIMLILYIQDCVRMSDIAAELDVTLPTATSFVDNLVKKNYVVREINPSDRRVVLCRLSEEGQKAISHIWESGRIRSEALLKHMDIKKLKMFALALDSMMQSTDSPANHLRFQAAGLKKKNKN